VTNSFYNDSTYRQRYPEICMMKEMMAYGVYRPMQDNYTKYSKIMARYFYLAYPRQDIGREGIAERANFYRSRR